MSGNYREINLRDIGFDSYYEKDKISTSSLSMVQEESGEGYWISKNLSEEYDLNFSAGYCGIIRIRKTVPLGCDVKCYGIVSEENTPPSPDSDDWFRLDFEEKVELDDDRIEHKKQFYDEGTNLSNYNMWILVRMSYFRDDDVYPDLTRFRFRIYKNRNLSGCLKKDGDYYNEERVTLIKHEVVTGAGEDIPISSIEESFTKETDSDGNFTFTGLQPGGYYSLYSVKWDSDIENFYGVYRSEFKPFIYVKSVFSDEVVLEEVSEKEDSLHNEEV